MKERDRVVTRDEIIASVWGEEFLGETRTLDMHIRSLRQKLGDDAENPKYIRTVRGVGYRFVST
jgi:two-component system alkaline phosphatase synthesis response regulator PhoP